MLCVFIFLWYTVFDWGEIMATNWTDEQRNAIYDNGGTLLVSAAAGSGKTAVLVERVVQKLLDKENPVDANRLLIVTFSNAAAAEMRTRIYKKLSEYSKNREYRRLISKQIVLLDTANISTIHAFCIKLLRRNFHVLNLSPAFSIADENEIAILSDIAINNVIKEYYAQNDPTFLSLVELLSSFRDDKSLVETVLKLYKSIRAYPFFRDWLKERLALYSLAKENPMDSLWAQVIFSYCADALLHAKNAAENALEKIAQCPAISAYKDAFTDDLDVISRAILATENRNLEELYQIIDKHSFMSLKGIRNCEDPITQAFVKGQREFIKSVFSDLSNQVCTDEKTFSSDISYLLPLIEKLFEITIAFSDRIDEYKTDRKLLDFSDVEQLTLELLVDRKDGKYTKSEIAVNLSDEFDEILIDEYQDTNAVQDMIFSAISKDDSNLFMVGDVKQSIYQFRQAMPELFVQKQNTYSKYDGNNYPALISLSKNFRSRNTVTDSINFFFSILMSDDFGQVQYSDGHALVCGASYPEADNLQTDVDFLSLKDCELESPIAQARHIATRIIELMTTAKVTDKMTGELRPPKFSDFAILLRAPKKVASQYISALNEAGIPAHFSNSDNCLGSIEIMTLLSLMRVINNPTLDVDLLVVLYSFLYSFSSDDMAKIRLIDRKATLYSNILKIAEDPSHDIHDKCKNFVEDIKDYRHNSSRMRIYEFIEYIYHKTDYPCLIGAKYDSEIKVKNLQIFKDFAVSFHSRPGACLNSFMRYMERVIESGGNLYGASGASDSTNAVQIMSIHHSKGLEFPICFVADLSHKFNTSDLTASTILHSQLGFACVRRDEDLHAQFNTILLTATRLATKNIQLSEELRMLYVALTRAKEKLILVIPTKNPDKFIDNLIAKNPSKLTTPYVLKNCSSFGQWILLCLLQSNDFNVLESEKKVELLTDSSGVLFSINLFDVPQEYQVITDGVESSSNESDEEIERYILESYSYAYPHVPEGDIVQKSSVSDISKKLYLMPMLTPQFEKTDVLTGAKKGTAMHKFMQFCDYKKAKEDAKSEIARLLSLNCLSEIQAKNIDVCDIEDFFKTSLADSLLKSDYVRRELKLSFLLDATEVDENCKSGDDILLQGIADCVFKDGDTIVVLDFKSDNIKTKEELIDRYSGQLKLYKKAVFNAFETDKVKCVLYSFKLKEVIELK